MNKELLASQYIKRKTPPLIKQAKVFQIHFPKEDIQMASKKMLNIFNIRKIEIKMTIIYHFTFSRMVKM